MTQNEQGAYGLQWPRWWVYWRGRMWLAGKYGCCPHCYSSPPNPSCFICLGNYNYGRKLNPVVKYSWLQDWDEWYDKKPHLIQDALMFVTIIVLCFLGVVSILNWIF